MEFKVGQLVGVDPITDESLKSMGIIVSFRPPPEGREHPMVVIYWPLMRTFGMEYAGFLTILKERPVSDNFDCMIEKLQGGILPLDIFLTI